MSARKHTHRARAPGDPIEELFWGNVNATIWRDESSDTRLFGVTFQKVFRNPVDKWDATLTFEREDMPTLARIALRTEDWLRCRGVD